MTRSLAREWGGDNITVNADRARPGDGGGDRIRARWRATASTSKPRHSARTAAADVCGAVLFALSDLARFVTGPAAGRQRRLRRCTNRTIFPTKE
jgi:NAD(P)-dependent dehydrogenase (short-subunit alcohol dehydrogenase family)